MLVVHACPAGPVSRCYGCDRPVSAVRRIVQAMLLAAVVLTAAAPCLAGPGVGAIRFWTAPDHTRIVVDLSDAAEYSTRVMTNPDRVVVHVADGVDAGVPKNTDIGDGLVDRVRANRLESGIQIVADLVAARGYNVFTLKPYSNKPHRIVIDVFREVAASAPTAPAETNMQTRMVVIDPGTEERIRGRSETVSSERRTSFSTSPESSRPSSRRGPATKSTSRGPATTSSVSRSGAI